MTPATTSTCCCTICSTHSTISVSGVMPTREPDIDDKEASGIGGVILSVLPRERFTVVRLNRVNRIIFQLKVLKAMLTSLFLYSFCLTFAGMRNNHKLQTQQYE